MVKIGVISSMSFNTDNFDEIVKGAFIDIIQQGKSYKVLYAFEQYITGYSFDYVFDTHDSYDQWLAYGIDKTICKVEYDWTINKALITIVDTNFPGPHEFECTGTWTAVDCQNAINSKFP
ncbi:MAG: hypothetical protein JEZ14_23065 [Marinilabiliaceae bacterium]|nr:hypothetical protein [Marinilabiliaceae bacterium]